jgi:nitrate reductase NapE component
MRDDPAHTRETDYAAIISFILLAVVAFLLIAVRLV